MENDPLEPDAHDEASPQPAPAFAGVHYVAAASLAEVLFEQLEYLTSHLENREGCPSPCRACARLDLVARFLLAPFRDPLNRV